jgi:hypothetical protein
LSSYELICKNTDQAFCNCEIDNQLDESQKKAIEKVVQEMILKQVSREVFSDSEIKPIYLVLIGVGITLLAVGIALTIAFLVIRRRIHKEKQHVHTFEDNRPT